MSDRPYDILPNGLKLRLRLTPGASRDQVKDVVRDEKGVAWLTASVTAVPENGRANKALVKLLAKHWRLTKSAIEIVGGTTDRRKSLLISGDPDHLSRMVSAGLDYKD